MIAITIDCEQWNSPKLRGIDDKSNDSVEYSFEGNKNLLKILEKHNVPATFFVTGFFAERKKDQIKEISKNHEIGCHGYHHFYRRNKNLNLKEDISKSKRILEKITKKKVTGFRAPQMQFSKELIEVLSNLNFKYDSSLHPAYLPGFYNNRNKPLRPFKIKNLLEIPASASYSMRLPISWIFIRNLPLFYSINIIKKLIRKNIIPVIYFHSWEFFKFRNKNIPFYITRGVGPKFCRKFDKLLSYFKDEKFVTLKEIN